MLARLFRVALGFVFPSAPEQDRVTLKVRAEIRSEASRKINLNGRWY